MHILFKDFHGRSMETKFNGTWLVIGSSKSQSRHLCVCVISIHGRILEVCRRHRPHFYLLDYEEENSTRQTGFTQFSHPLTSAYITVIELPWCTQHVYSLGQQTSFEMTDGARCILLLKGWIMASIYAARVLLIRWWNRSTFHQNYATRFCFLPLH